LRFALSLPRSEEKQEGDSRILAVLCSQNAG
jgi:hypothetical protein